MQLFKINKLLAGDFEFKIFCARDLKWATPPMGRNQHHCFDEINRQYFDHIDHHCFDEINCQYFDHIDHHCFDEINLQYFDHIEHHC